MISKLTKEQKNRIPEYRDKYIKIGLNTNPIKLNEAIPIIHSIQFQILKRPPTPVVILDNPILTWIAVCLFANSQVWSQVASQVWYQVRSQVKSQVDFQVNSQVRSQIENFISPYIDGQLWASYFSYFDFMREVIGVKGYPDLYNVLKQILNLFYTYLLKNVCILCQRPVAIRMKQGRLHADEKPAIEFAGNFNVYSLNGVPVSKEIAMTPAEKLDPRLLLKEKNAEVRREIVRKIGVERVCQKLNAKCIEKKGNYELLLLDLGDGRRRPYLKMRNPSTGTYHIEGVFSLIKTVREALNWRNQDEEETEILT